MIDRVIRIVTGLVLVLLVLSAGLTIMNLTNAQRFRNRQAEKQTEIAEKNQAYIDCLAKIFAQYTNDFKPVIIKDLTKCKTTNPAVSPTKTPNPSPSPTTLPPSNDVPPSSENKNPNSGGENKDEDTSYLTCVSNGKGPVKQVGRLLTCL